MGLRGWNLARRVHQNVARSENRPTARQNGVSADATGWCDGPMATCQKPAFSTQQRVVSERDTATGGNMKSSDKTLGHGVGGVLGAGFLSLMVGAPQAQAQAALERAAPRNKIEEVVVTAQRREESLQEIPLAVTVHTGEALENDNVDSLAGIGSQTPGLVFSAFSVGQPEISIRGVSTKEDGASANDSVVVSVDDVYIAARTAQVFDIFDLERVEVLRGPQGTLYGKNSVGGSINFVTLKPSEENVFRLRQSVGNFGRFDTAGLLSGALADNFFAKVSFSRRQHDGFITNVLDGSDFFGQEQGERTTFAIRPQAVWVPSDDLEFVFTMDYADDDIGASNREPLGSQGPLHDCGCAADPIAVNEALGGAGDPFSSLAETEGYTDREVFGGSAKITWSGLAGADFVSITSFRTSEFDWLEDSEGLPPATIFSNLTDPAVGAALTQPAANGFSFDITNSAFEETEQFTQEFRLLSAGSDSIRWLAGLFYSQESIDRIERFNFTALGIGAEPDNEQSVQGNDTTSVAGYGQLQYDLGTAYTLTAGLRYSYEEKEITVAAENLNANPAAVLLRGAPFGPVTAEEDFGNLTWRLALDYRVTDDALLYGSVSTGFKSGGFTGSASTEEVATTPFSEETAISYEAGIKSKWAGDRLLFNGLAFFTDYEDLQVTRFFQPVGASFGEFITENAGAAEIFGVELEFVALLTDWLEVGGNYAFLDAEFTDFQGLPSIAADGTVTDPGDFNGNALRLAPENTASLFIKAGTELSNGGSILGKLKYRFQDDMFFDPDNNPINVSPSYSLVDLWAAYTTPGERFEFKFWVNNLTDEEYVTHGFTQRGSRIAFGLFGEPRSWGLTVTAKL